MDILKQFYKNPIQTGAIVPSSKYLTSIITDKYFLKNKKCVVELGSGTGVFTKHILLHISPTTTFFCIEKNKLFAEQTKKNCPKATVYCDSAEHIQTYLHKHHQKKCDAIICGLPWSSFTTSIQKNLLQSIYASLDTNGEFLTFAYIHGLFLPSGIRFFTLLKKTFKEVKKSKIIWKNFPPAIVYFCKK